jgi:queuine tRNA-ribosyltransferase
MTAPSFSFRVTHADGLARRGIMATAHGTVETPAFMPVGTQGAVKALSFRDLDSLGAGMLLANTYHLYLRPGDGLIARQGGLHRFIGWPHAILTDSGGYQVFSLSSRRTISEEGAHFRSHHDGSAHLLTPEKAADIQAQLGSDIAMVFDECAAHPCGVREADQAMQRTLRWARRGRDRMLALRSRAPEVDGVTISNPGQAQFGIVQGSVYPHLREHSAAGTVAIGFEAYAIGGLSVGEPTDIMYDLVSQTTPLLPENQLRYLMGTGMPEDLVESVARGIDLFDCVLPTRNARNGQLFTSGGRLNIKNARYAEDSRPPDPGCGCYTCRTCSRAYLRHLFLSGEMVAATLNTLHNLNFYLDTMRRIRDAIAFGRFEHFRLAFHQSLSRQALD